jgi:hypothetical protein
VPPDAVAKERVSLSIQLTQLRQRYGGNHPSVRNAEARLAQMDKLLAQYAALPVQRMAEFDATLREYLHTLDAMQFNLNRLQARMGAKSRVVVDAKADVDLQKQRIDEYALNWRNRFTATTRP